MGMKFLSRIRKLLNETDYGLAKTLNQKGISITIPGISGYNKSSARSMRLDVLCGLRATSGLSWAEFGKWLDEEFLPKKP